jgi:hypothetical protein
MSAIPKVFLSSVVNESIPITVNYQCTVISYIYLNENQIHSIENCFIELTLMVEMCSYTKGSYFYSQKT